MNTRALAKRPATRHAAATMKMTARFLLLACLLPVTPLIAQEPRQNDDQAEQADNGDEGDDGGSNVEETEETHRRFWQANLPGGHYMVAIDRIASISMHEYLLDGQLVVTEIVVDTNGRGLARFYHVVTVAENSASGTARRVVEKGHELLDRAGQRAGTDVHNMAQKNYPATSHAGMIEYRILDLRDLQAIYKSLKNAWETGKGRRITVK